MTINTMTPRQRGFLETLARERQLSEVQETSLKELLDRADVPRADASRMIDALMGLPKKAAAAGGAGRGRVNFDDLPKAKFAIPTSDIRAEGGTGHPTNELMFFEIREFRGTIYMRELFGAPGAFRRERLNGPTLRAVVNIVRRDPLEASLRFSRHYSVCGKCAAELTVDRSRELGFGPHCADVMGLAY